MIFIRPENDTPFTAADFQFLNDRFLGWFTSMAIGEENLLSGRVDSLHNFLSRVDSITGKFKGAKVLIRLLALSMASGEKNIIDPQTLERELINLNWNEAAQDEYFPDAMEWLLGNRYIDDLLCNNNVPDTVISWFQQLSPVLRINNLNRLSGGCSDEQISLLSGVPVEFNNPLQLMRIRILDEDLFYGIVESGEEDFISLIADDSIGAGRSALRVLGVIHWRPAQLKDIFVKLDIVRILHLLNYFSYLFRNSDLPCPMDEESMRLFDEARELLGELAVDDSALSLLVNTIVDVMKERENCDATKIAELLFKKSILCGIDNIYSEENRNRGYSLLATEIAGLLAKPQNIETTMEWIVGYAKTGESILKESIFSQDILQYAIDIIIRDIEKSLPFLWLYVSLFPDEWLPSSNQYIDRWLSNILNWCGNNPSRMRSLLTLNMGKWPDENDQVSWAAKVIGYWLYTIIEEADENFYKKDKISYEDFILDYIEEEDVRNELSVFNESLDILLIGIQNGNSSVEVNPSVPVLIYFERSFNGPEESIQLQEVDGWIKVFKGFIQQKNVNALWDYFQLRKELKEVAYDIWIELGFDKNTVLIGTLFDFANSLQPDIGLAVARWCGYVFGLQLPAGDPNVLKDVLDEITILQNRPEPDPFLPLSLFAQYIRAGGNPAAIAESKKEELLTRSLSLLQNLRRTIKEGAFNAPDIYTAGDAAIIVGAASGDWWKAVKPLLLAFRNCRSLVVGENLVSFNFKSDPLYLIPRAVDHVLRNIKNDEAYKILRRNMALDFINKMKPVKGLSTTRAIDKPRHNYDGFDPGITEPDPVWRLGYIYALKDLAVKQTGKGNFITTVLKKVLNKDPSMKVRAAADEVVKYLDNLRSGWGTGSHKRRIFHAWWYLRQAHRIALNGGVNEKEANRVRNTEFR